MDYEDDRLKMIFGTRQGFVSFKRMYFGLINEGANFQQAMHIVFHGLINFYVIVYLDDVIIYFNNRSNHIKHLSQFFERCINMVSH